MVKGKKGKTESLLARRSPEFLDYGESRAQNERPEPKKKKDASSNNVEKNLEAIVDEKELDLHKHYLDPKLDRICKILEQSDKANFSQPTDYKKNLELADRLVDLGHNVLFHGFGNKEKAVEKYFVNEYQNTHIIIKVKGYDGNFTPRALFIKLIEHFNHIDNVEAQKVIEKTKKKRNVDLRVLQGVLSLILRTMDEKVLIIFHNLDGPNFANQEVLEVLSLIGKEKRVRFVATIDSIILPQLLTKVISDNFSFIYLSLNTQQLYAPQLKYLRYIDFSKKGNQIVSTVLGILDSLTENQK